MIILAVLAALAAAVAPPADLPTGCFAEALPEMNAALTREDSLALAARYEHQPPGGDRSCGQLLAGYLIGMTSTPAEDSWRERLRGIELLEAAFRSHSGDPRLYIAMGLLLYHRQGRTDALRNLKRALDRREAGEVPLTAREVAIIHYNRGLIHQDFWRDWRSYGNLSVTAGGQWHGGRYEMPGQDNFSGSSDDHTWLIALNQLCPARFAENMEAFFDPWADMNRDAFNQLEDAFLAALETDSTFLLPGEALLGEYVYLEEWEKAERLAHMLYERFPENYRTFLYVGLVLHETGRDSAAAPAFAKSFLYMPDSIAAAITSIWPLLQPEQREWLDSADETTRRSAETAFWNSLDPLYLTAVNERKLEHYARVVAADLMFGSPALRERGSGSYAGEIWIRYGRPKTMWELKLFGGRVAFWDYGPGPDVSFIRGAAYRSFRPTDEAKQYTNQLLRTSPQTYSPDALVDSVWSLGYQTVRFLGAQHRPEFLVYTEWPAEFAPEAIAGLTLLDQQFLPVAQWQGGKPDRPGFRAVLRGIPPGMYSLTVEILDPGPRQLGRVRDTLSTLAIEDSTFVVSDVLLASGVASLVGDGAVSRREMEITPLYGSTLESNQTLGLYWEVYRLSGAQEGRVRYRVSVEIQDAGRRPILARILSGVAGGGDRPAATRIEYDSDRPMQQGRAVEWLELTGQLRPGEYRVIVTITDRESGNAVTRERALVVR